MADVYFGATYKDPAAPALNGNWTDINQWFSDLGFADKYGVTYATPLGRLPTQADQVWFYQSLLSNFPTTWTGATVGLWLGSNTVSATGTWSGQKGGGGETGRGFEVYSNNNSVPVISGTWTTGGALINGGSVTCNTHTNFAFINLASGIFTPSAAINSNNCSLAVSGGNLNATITNSSQFNMSGGTANGSVTTRVFIMSGGTITNSPTITHTGAGGLTYTGGSFPNTTRLVNSNTSSLTQISNMISSANIAVNSALIISNSNLTGNITIAGNTTSRLIISSNSTIATDISTATTNFRNFRISNSNFTNANPWVFGTITRPALVDIGGIAQRVVGSNPLRWTLQTFSTSKNITVYANSTANTIFFNYPRELSNTTGVVLASLPGNIENSNTLGTYTGLITILPTTGSSIPLTIYVGGGTYAPTVTIAATNTGGIYSVAYNNIPKDYGFREANTAYPKTFNPTFFISGLPSGIDVLGTQI